MVSDNGDANPIGKNCLKVDHIRKSRHRSSTSVPVDCSPSRGARGDTEDLALELREELTAKTGDALVVKIASIFQLALNGGVILDGHRRSLAISSSWDMGLTWPDSIS